MERRIFAMAAVAAAMTLLGAHPAAASQCTQACDKSYQQCSAGTADSTKCLPAWGQCKKACAGPVAAKPATAPAATAAKVTAPTPKAKVTKVTTAKAKPAKAKAAGH